MKRNQFPLLLTILGLLSFFVISCIDLPDEMIAPTWDLNLNFPITDSTITLGDMIDGDSSIVTSENPQSLGLLFFMQENLIDPIFVDTNLTLDEFSLTESQVIGPIKVYDIDTISQNVLVTDWAPTIVPGDSMVFPESENDLEIPFSRIKSFTYAVLDEGILKIKITNNLPVSLELRGIKIRNIIDKEIVASRTTTFILEPHKIDSLTFDLAGKRIEDSLYYEGTIYSRGSNGQKIKIPNNAGTFVRGTFENIIIAEVKAVLPEQEPFTKEDVFSFDDSVKIGKTIFRKGSFSFTLNNYLDVGINVKVTIDNLKRENGDVFTEVVKLDRNEVNKIISYPNLFNWQLETLQNGIPTNKIKYSTVISSIVSTEPSIISKTDSIGFAINFDDASLKYFSGIITPVEFDIPETNFDFDLGEIKNKLKYNKLVWGNPGITLSLNSSVDMDINLAGILNGTNGSTNSSMNFDAELTGNGISTIDLREQGLVNFLNSFQNEIPDNFSFAGSAIINPNYILGKIEDTDSIFGKVNIEIPLDVGIAGGVFTDTVTVDSIDIADEDIESVNSVALTIEISNAIPIGLKMSGSVLDRSGKVLFPFPPKYNNDSQISFNPPTVDANGYVTTPAKSIQTIELHNADARTFIDNPKLLIKLELNTSGANGGNVAPVKFRNTDYIYYKIYGKVNYRVQ